MKFARFVFIGAGVWGVVVLTPLIFLVDISGRRYLPPTSYPQFFYGFMGAFSWALSSSSRFSRPVAEGVDTH
jgi:hypothetical protein